MNRQMVWHAFTEFLLFILPLVNLRIYRRRLSQFLAALSSRITRVSRNVIGVPSAMNGGSPVHPKAGKYATLPLDNCAICAEDANLSNNTTAITPSFPSSTPANILPESESSSSRDSPSAHPINIPYLTSCGHIYCYYCLTTRMMQVIDFGDVGWECLRCGDLVLTAQRAEEDNIAFDGSERWSDSGSSTASDEISSSRKVNGIP